MAFSSFTPNADATVNLTAGVASTNVALPAAGEQLRLYNAHTATVFYELGTSSASTAATTTGVPLPAGAVEVISVGPQHTYLAAIAASGSGTLYATKGNGF